jgi:hypothetical protein
MGDCGVIAIALPLATQKLRLWADSTRTRVVSGRTGVGAKAVV